MTRTVPIVEVTYEANAFGIGRPDGECDASSAFMRDHVRAELLMDAFMFTLAEKMNIYIAEGG